MEQEQGWNRRCLRCRLFSQVLCVIEMQHPRANWLKQLPLMVMGLHLLTTFPLITSPVQLPHWGWLGVLPGHHGPHLYPFRMGHLLKVQGGELWSQMSS